VRGLLWSEVNMYTEWSEVNMYTDEFLNKIVHPLVHSVFFLGKVGFSVLDIKPDIICINEKMSLCTLTSNTVLCIHFNLLTLWIGRLVGFITEFSGYQVSSRRTLEKVNGWSGHTIRKH
jgi:hypothetical protein